ncbi:ABC transporter ATP-binding protein [Patescibacteria group bacterium]|nr:ABC transporter ATP-binding protein [Candidatus Falkowbacteria bacterium]MBU3905423.1 ABC transporter ATP-binding protein [Patescibacteria group bacterium]MCG2698676.1 ABC transporter ATP-binding protein [Candidatus Parcubacteria bacterium]MBU4014817.1 ABC transporter ATP-binding protein [Patescibacteria group bacterium]MBU4027123.1 ABC transporter ATP-binding protein [Patescibacteria group bacterium]
MEPLIEAKKLNFVYNKGKDNEFQALINVSLKIYPEELVIFFGPSGCGKSTLLNIIAGLEIPQSGNIVVSGKEVSTMDKKEFVYYHRKSIGMIYQAYNLINSLSVLDNVALPQIFLNIKKREREKKALKLLERFGIIKQAKKIPVELSGGQQQRIGIARAIINDPDIILADEPIGNLDSVSAKNVLEILKNELNEKEKKTIILVTHNPEYLEYGDRIFYMKDGMVTRETVPREKYKAELDQSKTFAKAPTAELEDMMRVYKGLTPEQINIIIMPYKARLFAHHFITNRNMEETRIFEDAIQKKLLHTISSKDFFNLLDRPYQDGGVGLDKRTAEKIFRKVNRKIRIAHYIYRKGHQRKDKQGKHKKITNEEKARKLTFYLLKTYYGSYKEEVSDIMLSRLGLAVNERLFQGLNKAGFLNFLDKPFKDGGVGLNSKTARAITEEIELILILGYGIEQNMRNKDNSLLSSESTDKHKADIANRLIHDA